MKKILLFLTIFNCGFVIAGECSGNKKTFAEWYETDAKFENYKPSKLLLSSDACFIEAGSKKTGIDQNEFKLMIGQGLANIDLSKDKDVAFENFLKKLTENYDVYIDPQRSVSKFTGNTNFTLVSWENNNRDNNEVTYHLNVNLVKLGVNI